MKQKIAIARALVHYPKYLFLDEPTSGLDPVSSITVRNYLMDLKREGRTIFINTYHLNEAQRLCDKIGILKTRLLSTGSPEKLANEFLGKATMVELDVVSPEILRVVQGSKGSRRLVLMPLIMTIVLPIVHLVPVTTLSTQNNRPVQLSLDIQNSYDGVNLTSGYFNNTSFTDCRLTNVILEGCQVRGGYLNSSLVRSSQVNDSGWIPRSSITPT